MSRFIRLAALSIAAAALGACASAKPAAEEKQPVAQPKLEQQPDKSAQQKAEERKAEGQVQLDKAMDRLRDVSVFFEFDESTLTKEATDRLQDVAGVLVKYPELKVKIEGHADERGTPAYNLALGQRRAESTKGYLVKMGVKDDQIEKTISYGSEKPKAEGHTEDAWKQNRRGDVSAADGK
jgi:peptidoglycan-associated lipoprotein